MAKQRWFDRLFPKYQKNSGSSFLRSIVSGSLYRLSDIRRITSLSDIKTQIDTMRVLATDSQIDTALSYYATDATTTNTAGQIIWATADNDKYSEAADIINELFKRWKVNLYARDHILELATIGNLYLPTTDLYNQDSRTFRDIGVVLDNNTLKNEEFDIIPSYKIPPENIIHLWYQGKPSGYLMNPDDDNLTDVLLLPEQSVIHFSLGGLLGEYKVNVTDKDGEDKEYDIQFATPLMAKAVQPTQTLNLMEDAVVLSSLSRTIKFLNVECGANEDEILSTLQQIKDIIEQQLSLDTRNGDVQSYVNPQSPNNLIYLPRVNGQDPISITDLNMAETNASDDALLNYYQDKKLSVLGVPKEAMNYSSNEGLGGAGSVLSQRSAIYANALLRLETAYMEGWKSAINTYFKSRGLSGFIDKFTLHMNPIVTTQSTVQFEKRDAALGQAQAFVQLLRDLNIVDNDTYQSGLVEILSEVFPQLGEDSRTWDMDVSAGGGEDAF